MRYDRAAAKQAAREDFQGIWAAITTPFLANGGVDEVGLAHDLEYLSGPVRMDGIFCTGVMGEFWALTAAERNRIVSLVVQGCAGRMPVIAHTGHHSARDTIALTRAAEEVGADYAVVVTPYYPTAPAEGLEAWFTEVLRAVDMGVWLFDTNYATAPMPLDLVDRLADEENVCGIKVGHDHAHYLKVLDRVGDRILVCEPNESEWLGDVRDHGQRVYMSSSSPFLYQTPQWQPMREYTDLALSGEYEKAAQVSATMDPVRQLASRWLHGRWHRDRENPVPYIKAWSQVLGMAGGPVRPPLPQVPAEQIRQLADELHAVGLV